MDHGLAFELLDDDLTRKSKGVSCEVVVGMGKKEEGR